MNKTLLAVSVVLAQMLAVNAFAQVKGEVDESCSRAVPSPKCTPDQIAAAKAARKAEGTAAAKAPKADADPSSLGTAKKVSKDERKIAAAKRKAATAEAVKKGQIPSGEK